jgi:hypothetical protein
LRMLDQKRYGCDFNWQVDRVLKAHDPAKTILQPKNNLKCGVKILFNQTIVQHKPLLTRSSYRSSYWLTLRAGRTKLPSLLQADDKSPLRMWPVHQVEDQQVDYDEVRAGRREIG